MAILTLLDKASYSGALTRPRSASAWLLRAVRVLSDLNQKELAAATGLSHFSICNYESAARTPSRLVRQHLARALNCPELLLWDPTPITDELSARRQWAKVLRRFATGATRAEERRMLTQMGRDL